MGLTLEVHWRHVQSFHVRCTCERFGRVHVRNYPKRPLYTTSSDTSIIPGHNLLGKRHNLTERVSLEFLLPVFSSPFVSVRLYSSLYCFSCWQSCPFSV